MLNLHYFCQTSVCGFMRDLYATGGVETGLITSFDPTKFQCSIAIRVKVFFEYSSMPSFSNRNAVCCYFQMIHRIHSQRSSIADFNNKINKLCKHGLLHEAINQIGDDAMIGFNSDTLNALLNACSNENNASMAVNVWTKLVVQRNVIPDIRSYRMAICLIARNDSKNRTHQHFVYGLVHELQTEFKHRLSDKEWWSILECHRAYGDAHDLLNEFENMQSSGQLPTKYVLSSLFEGLLASDSPFFAEFVWHHILQTYDTKHILSIFDSRTLQSMLVCVGRSGHRISDGVVCDVWTLLVTQNGLKPELCCYCLAVFILSKCAAKHSESLSLCNDLLLRLSKNEKMKKALKMPQNALFFHQILSSFGRINELDAMWMFYSEIASDEQIDVMAVNLLSATETRLEILRERVFPILERIDLNTLSVADLIGFYRVANKCNNDKMTNILWNILKRKKQEMNISKNVICSFELNGTAHFTENGYKKECVFKSVVLIEELMQRINHSYDLLSALELNDDVSRKRHLKSHCEKKALSILLRHCDDAEITMSVSMRMCCDCHNFFVGVSKLYSDRIINCKDPRGVHSFSNGICSLCD